MSDTKFLRIIIVCLIVLNIGTLSYLFLKKSEKPPGRNGRGKIIEYLSDELKFSNEQLNAVKKMHEENRERIDKIKAEDRELHDRYFDGLNENTIDSAKVDSLATLIAANRKKIEIQTFYHFSRIRTICTEEQKLKFGSIVNEALRMMAPPLPPPR